MSTASAGRGGGDPWIISSAAGPRARPRSSGSSRPGRRLMLQHGYEEVSIRDICREAGVTTGAFYHHFSSKEQMLEMGGQQLDLYIQQQLRTRPHRSSLRPCGCCSPPTPNTWSRTRGS